jgi:hypothetical protein
MAMPTMEGQIMTAKVSTAHVKWHIKAETTSGIAQTGQPSLQGSHGQAIVFNSCILPRQMQYKGNF